MICLLFCHPQIDESKVDPDYYHGECLDRLGGKCQTVAILSSTWIPATMVIMNLGSATMVIRSLSATLVNQAHLHCKEIPGDWLPDTA